MDVEEACDYLGRYVTDAKVIEAQAVLVSEIDRLRQFAEVDFFALDNSDPPQVWAWAGTPGDESAEPLFCVGTIHQ